jgi:hypothetical protein
MQVFSSGGCTMYEHEDAERIDEPQAEREHPARCACCECDPDSYFDPADRARDEG